MKIGIGIDTGGTYTDAVIYHFEQRQILGTTKALTTKENLSIGIRNALDAFPIELLRQAEILSLSTTLATNACVENKGGRSAMLFFGVDPNVVKEFGHKYGFSNPDDIFYFDSQVNFQGTILQEPDWNLVCDTTADLKINYDSTAIVELYSIKNNAAIEKKAKNLLEATHAIQTVCGYELCTDLNCLQRGASALLNARLIPVIHDFLSAIKRTLAEKNLTLPIVIVRSDGSLMSEDFTKVRPVETLLCGPAASVISGVKLTNEPNSILVDMGGTTSDVAIVKNGSPKKVKSGIQIGAWKTFVKGLFIRTFGLGGDSAVRYRHGQFYLDEQRVIPISILAAQYPHIIDQLEELVTEYTKHSYFIHEFYTLVKDISDKNNYTAEEKAFCYALKKGPLILKDAAAAIQKDVYTFDMQRLEREGVVLRAGLTPTDIMHIKGDFALYNKKAAQLAAQYVAICVNTDADTLADMVYNEVKYKLYDNLCRILLETEYDIPEQDSSSSIDTLIRKGWELANQADSDSFAEFRIQTKATLIGIGAPIHIFLPDVSKALGTKCIIPDNAGVANALGAILGNIHVTKEILVKPNYNSTGAYSYTVYGENETLDFESLEEAEQYAETLARQAAEEEAKSRGASGEITVTSVIHTNKAAATNTLVHFDTKAIATAIGQIGF